MSRLLSVLLLMPIVLSQAEVTVAELDAHPQDYDGQVVVITGEVIGDYGVRHDVVWVQLNTDSYVASPLRTRADARGGNSGIGVRYPRALHDPSWGPPGTYGVRGPILRVEGVFRYNDAATSGETFIDASSIELVDPSQSSGIREPEAGIWFFAAASALGGLALYGSAWLRRRRRIR